MTTTTATGTTARLKGKGVTDVDVEKLTDILSARSTPPADEGA